MFNRLRRDGLRILLLQGIAFGVSWLMVTYVFLGPLPRISPQFKNTVKEAPANAVAFSKKTVTTAYINVASYMKPRQKTVPGGSDSPSRADLPPPWVFGDTVVSTPTPYVEPPKDEAKPTWGIPRIPLPTAAPTSSSGGGPSRPTQSPQQQPTAIPQPTAYPTQRPVPTAIPEPTLAANPSQLEDSVLAEINRRRKGMGLVELRMQGNLQQAARGHSSYMKSSGNFSHTGSGGSTPYTRAKAAKYQGQPHGETIIVGYSDAVGIVEAWWNSPGHKVILTNKTIRQAGIGFAGTYGTALVGY